MPMRRSLLLLVSFFALVGCATPEQKEDARLEAAATRAVSEMIACRAREAALPAYQALKDRLPPLDGSAPSPNLQANKEKPAPQDVPLLVEFHRDGIAPCQKVTLDNITRVNPALAPTVVEAQVASEESYARLVRREIGWGDYAMGSYLRTAALRAELLNIAVRLDEQAALAKIRELQNRQAATTGAAPAVGPSGPPATR